MRMSQVALLSAPLYAEVALTSRCNLRCIYCHFFDSPNETAAELGTGEWLRVFDEFGAMKVMSVTLSGGEALLRDDLQVFIERIVANGMRFSILSNGFAFEESHAKMLAGIGHCNQVQISIDGVGEVHDAARGKGSFARALQAIRILQAHNIPVNARITAGKHNFAVLPETVRFLLDEVNLSRVGCNSAIDFSSSDEFSRTILLSRREFLSALVGIRKLRDEYQGRVDISNSTFSSLGYGWPRMIRALRDRETPIDRSKDCRCFPAFTKIFVRADGAITPCNHLPAHIMGYVGKDKITDLWNNSAVMTDLATPDSVLSHICAECRECEYLPYCPQTGYCVESHDRVSAHCLKSYMAEAPDFDFEELRWKNDC